MSWRHPRIRPKTGDAMNIEIFDGMRSYQEEMSGRLGEQNWKAGAFTSRSHIAEDAMYTYDHDARTIDPGLTANVTPVENVSVRISEARQWVPIPASASTRWRQTETATTRELWHIVCSFQVMLMEATTGRMANPTLVDSSCKYAIAVDGVVQIGEGVGRDNDTIFGGLCAGAYSVVLHATVNVEPGQHTYGPVAYLLSRPVSSPVSGLRQFPEVFDGDLYVVRHRA
jgi:hypothetical protein